MNRTRPAPDRQRSYSRSSCVLGVVCTLLALLSIACQSGDGTQVVADGTGNIDDTQVAVATSPPLVVETEATAAPDAPVDTSPTTAPADDDPLADASPQAGRAVVALDADPDDALGAITQASLAECFDSAVEQDPGVASVLEDIATTSPGSGLTPVAAEFVADCFLSSTSGPAVVENFADDGLTISLSEAQCASDAYANGDADAIVADLIVSVIRPAPSPEVLAQTYACASSETLAAWLATVDVAATGDEARCFYTSFATLTDDSSFAEQAVPHRCLSDAALASEFGANLAAIDHTPAELRCALGGIFALASDPELAFAEYSACGIAGRTFAFTLSLSRGVMLSDPTIACLDDAFARLTATDDTALRATFAQCATDAEREAEANAPG